jgi:hypothetical protein
VSAALRIRLMMWLAAVIFATLAVFAAVSAAPAPVVKDAQAHAPWTCRHGTVGHWDFGRRHEVRYRRHWWTDGRHVHRYHYYTWSLGTSWVYKGKKTYDCTGAHSN